MQRIDHVAIAVAILNSPGWARIGITAPTPTMRHTAAHELARIILQLIDGAEAIGDSRDQPRLGM